MHRLSGLLLVIALLLGRASLLEHEYDFAAHKPGDTCVTCLHASPLGHAVTGVVEFALPFLLSEASYVHVTPPLSTVAHHAYRARAPPRHTTHNKTENRMYGIAARWRGAFVHVA